jgi:DNA-binding beta-propeller fold protein YncE
LRTTSPVLIGALAAVVLLAGCLGSQTSLSITPGSRVAQSERRSFVDLARTGVAPQFLPFLRIGRSTRAVEPANYTDLNDLYVSDFGSGKVEILTNKAYRKIAAIARGLDGPDGDFLDARGNLYVANWAGDDITEYPPGATSPSHTYNAGMTDPVNVSVDPDGNVYESDFNGGFVNEYAQASNHVVATCSPGGQVSGVAVDNHGDVFVAYGTNIAEYKGGLAACNEKVLKATLGFAGGMVLDEHDNLVVCDQLGPTVDVIAPPYARVTNTIGSGFTEPLHVTLNKANTLAFVADDAAKSVTIINYKTGTNLTRLARANGLADPSSAVDRPNADY